MLDAGDETKGVEQQDMTGRLGRERLLPGQVEDKEVVDEFARVVYDSGHERDVDTAVQPSVGAKRIEFSQVGLIL